MGLFKQAAEVGAAVSLECGLQHRSRAPPLLSLASSGITSVSTFWNARKPCLETLLPHLATFLLSRAALLADPAALVKGRLIRNAHAHA